MSRPHNPGRVAGFLYLLLCVVAPWRLVYIPRVLFVPGDATATASSILAHERLFRFGIVSDLLAGTLTLFVVLALYRLLQAVDRNLAALMVILGSLMVTPICFLNTVNDAAALVLVRGGDFLAVFDKAQRDALAMLFLRLHHQGIVANEIFWGLWLFPLAILIYRSRFLPRFLGVWLMINGFAYLAISFTGLLLPRYEDRVSKIAFPAMLGEIALMLWLVSKGAAGRTSAPSPAVLVSEAAGGSTGPATSSKKTADRPHPITIGLGLLSPLLALISLGVSFYVFWGSQRSMRVAQRAYLGFHFESGQIAPEPGGKPGGPRTFRVEAKVSVKNIGNTPAYIDTVQKELYAIEGDDMWDHIGGSREVSPNFDALSPKGEPLLLEYNSAFGGQELTGDRSVVYRAEIRWHDAFGENQPPAVFCAILRDASLPIVENRPLSAEPCIKGMTLSVGSSR